ncbi:MAG: hypothetical protein ACRD4F_02530, partial [Candidatus Angelobacter sp.]
APGNVDPVIQQIDPSLLQGDITSVNQLVSASVGQPNYFTIPGSTISSSVSYGTATDPAIVVAGGDLKIQGDGTVVTGFGILVVPNNLEIDSAALQWTGIVLVQPPSGEFRLDNGATGFINGALLLQGKPDSSGTTNVRTSDSDSKNFTISYSCEAIDLAFQAAPLKIIPYSEVSY